jgi:hypothetical protein
VEIESIPTQYSGVTFRSRLEARWAQFFDVIGVNWQYEPMRIEGWIPDFLIDGRWLAEVKPTPITSTGAAHHEPFAKAIRDFDTLLLGEGPGDALGLVVRRESDGSILARYLVADLEAGPASLHVFPFLPRGFRSDLAAFWQGLSNQLGAWQPPPSRSVVFASCEAAFGPDWRA